ncbi:hypothetical protein EFN43_06665 [Pediococcus pentosaceus]|jgi:hypothetical protein|uniref:hypothetical protein n=1 Tax=Pediococcus pentosaceus TaxID=1255 RepID=UPI001F56C187|nr:hypothetical protein [Pediococcus pentosaceus]MCI2961480.1 hypothetical protein [Pediococcus pentosaceus]MCT3020762.1 hypothetical protein [Pediococcus pentosaceus]
MVNVKLRGIAEGRLGTGNMECTGTNVLEIVKEVSFQDENLKHNLFDESKNMPRRLCKVLVNGKIATLDQPVDSNDDVMLGTVFTCDG